MAAEAGVQEVFRAFAQIIFSLATYRRLIGLGSSATRRSTLASTSITACRSRRLTGTLLKLALADGLLATGAGSGIGAALLFDAPRPKADAATATEQTDRDTQYELRLGRAE